MASMIRVEAEETTSVWACFFLSDQFSIILRLIFQSLVILVMHLKYTTLMSLGVKLSKIIEITMADGPDLWQPRNVATEHPGSQKQHPAFPVGSRNPIQVISLVQAAPFLAEPSPWPGQVILMGTLSLSKDSWHSIICLHVHIALSHESWRLLPKLLFSHSSIAQAGP